MDYRPFGLLDVTPGLPAGGVAGRTPSGADDLGRLLYSMTGAGGAQDAAGLLGGPSVRENLRSGNNFDAGLQMLAALPVVGMLGSAPRAAGKVARGAQDAAKAAEEAQGIIAYHGSPHSFDKFDLSKIGTGEGAQAYGHGLYFAESEPVAKAYRDNLASPTLKTPGGEIFDPQTQLKHLNVRVAARNNGSDLDATIARAQQLLSKGNEQTRPLLEQDLETLMRLKESGGVAPNKGSMYQVRINADPNAFLDWDKPLSEQPVVRDKLMRYVFPDTAPMATSAVEARGGASIANKPPVRNSSATAGVDNAGISIAGAVDGPTLFNDYTFGAVRTQDGFHPRVETPNGQRIYRDVTLPSRTEAEAAGRSRVLETVARPQNAAESQFLNAAGIPGIKYLDQGSRSAGEGSRNYVVFDDSLIDILKKYGLIGLLGGGAAASGVSGINNTAPAGGNGAPVL